jgi:Cft2 family RNA processing exonuclease
VQVSFTASGIHLPELDLWLDSTQDEPLTWVSHGHADHARGRHASVLATAHTAEFFGLRNPDPQSFRILRYGEAVKFGEARLTAYPAGHILGSASLLVEFGGERLLYTGDIKLLPPLLGDPEPVEIPRCDRLILESTFGLPVFHFLDAIEARARIVRFAETVLGEGGVPVFVGYALGRGQEIAHCLCQAGIPVALHGAIARLLPVYERAGFTFPGWVPYRASDKTGRALVVTPSFRSTLEASGKEFRLAYVSGWARLDHARSRTGAEELIPYSDHAGFSELLRIVELASPKEVDVIHGYTQPLARIFEQRGYVARAPMSLANREDDETGG